MEHLINEIYKNIFKDDALDNLSIFIEDYETYEEIPIVSRFSQVDFLNDAIGRKELTYFLHQIAVFYVNNIILYAKNKLPEKEFLNFFISIVYLDCDSEIKNEGFCIPNICVSRKKYLFDFLSETELPFNNIGVLKLHVNKNNATYYISRFFDESSDEEINRIYIVPAYDELIDIRRL